MNGDTGRAPSLLPPKAAWSSWRVVACGVAGAAAAVLMVVGAALAAVQPALASRLSGSMTVAVSGRMDGGALETSDAAAARAREVLAALPVVAGVRVLEPSALDPLLARVLRAPAASGDTGLPRLLSVSLRGPGGAARAPLARALAAEGLLFAIDDHGVVSGPCERLGALMVVALVVGLLVLLAAVTSIGAGATSARADEAWARLDLLAQFGADPNRLERAVSAPVALRTTAWAGAGVCIGLGVAWLRWPPAAPVVPPLAVVAGLAVAWLAAAGLAAQRAGRWAAERRLRALFS